MGEGGPVHYCGQLVSAIGRSGRGVVNEPRASPGTRHGSAGHLPRLVRDWLQTGGDGDRAGFRYSQIARSPWARREGRRPLGDQ